MSRAGILQAPLFGNEAAPRVCTNDMKREALERELNYRRNVYPRLIAEGKMRRSQADLQIWILEQILLEGYVPR